MATLVNPNELATANCLLKTGSIFDSQNPILFAPNNQRWATNLSNFAAQEVVAAAFGEGDKSFFPARTE